MVREPSASRRKVVDLIDAAAPNPPLSGGLDRTRAAGRDRYRRATMTSIVSAIGLGATALTTLLTVPVMLRYLGAEPYGVWLTIAGAAAWLGLAQIGLAPSLLNQLAAATGSGDEVAAKRLVATAWWYQIAISIGLALVALVVFPAIPWARVLNTSAPIADAGRIAATVVWVGILLSLPATIPSAAFRAFQEGYLAAAWDVTRNILRLIAVFVAVALDAGMPGLAVAWIAPQLIVGLASSLQLFMLQRPALRPRIADVHRATGKLLLGVGLSFSGISIAGLVISYTDNIVITQVIDPASVPRYAVTFAIVQLVVALEMGILDAAWPAYAEAAASRDLEWLVKAHRRFTGIVVAIAASFAVALVIAGRAVVRIWAGPAAEPPDALILIFAALVVVQSVLLAYGRLLTAIGGVRTNMRLGLANAAINLPLSILFAMAIGLPGVALGTLIGYVVIGAFLITRSRRDLRRMIAVNGVREERPPVAAPE